jgi:hypothetical protein
MIIIEIIFYYRIYGRPIKIFVNYIIMHQDESCSLWSNELFKDSFGLGISLGWVSSVAHISCSMGRT